MQLIGKYEMSGTHQQTVAPTDIIITEQTFYKKSKNSHITDGTYMIDIEPIL